MIPKRLDDISENDLLALLNEGVAEGRTLEYKRELPGNDDSDKKEFLADVSSFANAGGGDLIFGMDESQGVPIEITGFQSSDSDFEIRRLESILASGLAPRFRYTLRMITCKNDRKTLIIRVERSWTGPHRVIFKGHDKFYSRNSAGKYALDVNELRAAFTLSSTVTERIRAFRVDRIIAISNNQTPIPFKEGPKIVLHCIPIDSFSSQTEYNILPFYEDSTRLRPMGSSGWGRRLNLDGVVAFAGGSPSSSYTQLYRNGTIEAVEGNLLSNSLEYRRQQLIPSIAYERDILEYLEFCLRLLQNIGSCIPIVVALTLTGTRGFRMSADGFSIENRYPIDRDMLFLPEVIVPEFSTPPNKILKPIFDLIWNACGYPSSKNFDVDGNWNARR